MVDICKSNDFETIFDKEHGKLYLIDLHFNKIVAMLNLDCWIPCIEDPFEKERHIRDFVEGSIPTKLYSWNMYMGRDTARKVMEIMEEQHG